MSDSVPITAGAEAKPLREICISVSVGLMAAILAVAVANNVLIGAAMAVAAVLCLAMLRQTELATLTVLFLLYANAPVVAVKFHSVPKVAAALLPALLLLPLADLLLRRRYPLVLPKSLPWVLLYLIVQVAGVALAVKPEEAAVALLTFLAEGLGIYLLFTNLLRTRQMFRATAATLVAAGILMGGLPLFQQVTKTHDRTFGGFAQMGEKGFSVGEGADGKITQARSSGPIGEKNRYAQVMLMLVPIGMFLAFYEVRVRDRILALIATVIAAAGMVLAFSRGAIVGVVMTMMTAVGLGYVQRKHVMVIVGGAALMLLMFPQYWGRIASLSVFGQLAVGNVGVAAEADGAVRGRATEMGAAGLVFLDHPLIGVGSGMFKYYAIEYGERIGLRALQENREAHCLYLDVAAQSGILGLTFLLSAVGTVAYRLHRARSRLLERDPYLAQLAGAFLLMIVVYMTTGIFLHFAYIRYFWLMLGISEALIAFAARPVVIHPQISS